jgi:hypothetical protein
MAVAAVTAEVGPERQLIARQRRLVGPSGVVIRVDVDDDHGHVVVPAGLAGRRDEGLRGLLRVADREQRQDDVIGQLAEQAVGAD